MYVKTGFSRQFAWRPISSWWPPAAGPNYPPPSAQFVLPYQVGSDEPRGSSGNCRQVDGGREGDRLGVDPQDLLPALQIWAVERHLAVPGSAVAAATAACFLPGEPEDAGMRGLDCRPITVLHKIRAFELGRPLQ
jgi:hypothetical protein